MSIWDNKIKKFSKNTTQKNIGNGYFFVHFIYVRSSAKGDIFVY